MKKTINYYLKTFLLTVLVFGFIFETNAQENQKSKKIVDSLALKMFVDTNNRDYDAIVDMMHPKVFDLVSKDIMKSTMRSMFEGTEEFSIDLPKQLPNYLISEIYTEKSRSLEYAFVSYDLRMSMTFNEAEFDDEGKSMMKSMMQAKGMDIDFISDNTLKILMKDRTTILMQDNDTNNKWVMINYDPDSPLTYQVLPTSLLEKAKEFQQNLMLKRKKKEED